MGLHDESDRQTRGAVILCGGGSRRMGRDKASLPFGDETLLSRTLRLVAEVVPRGQIILVAAMDQQLPPLPWDATVIRDQQPDRGPLPAIIEGLTSLGESVSTAFVTACDAPLLEPSLIELLFASLMPKMDAVVPAEGERLHSLLAVYRRNAAASLRASLEAGRSSLHAALRSPSFRLTEVPVEELRTVDPQLLSLLNCNTPEEYATALALL